jgi:hypothetical protein
MTMASRKNQGAEGSANSAPLEALLDKLVAVQLDLEPICGVRGEGTSALAGSDAIAGACDILHSAIADLRRIIHQVDGSPNR